MTKKEKKLIKAAKKLEKVTQKYMEELSKVDKIMQDMPTKLTRRHNLEERYFEVVPTAARAAIKFELLYSYLLSEIGETHSEAPDWEINDPDNGFWEGSDTDLL
jgi:DNA repair protein RadC